MLSSICKKWLLCLGMLLALPLAAQGTDLHTGDTAPAAARTGSEVLTVAVRPEFAPYTLRDESGAPTGFDVDLLKAVAAAEGFQVRFIGTPAEGLVEAFKSGIYDIGASGIRRTPAWEEHFLFSAPVSKYTYTLVVRADSGIQKVADLKGRKIAIVEEDEQAGVLKETLQGTPVDLDAQPSMYIALQGLFEGEVDAVFGASTLLRFHAALRDRRFLSVKLRFITFESLEKSYYTYFVVNKGRQDLLDRLNSGLKKLQASGQYHAINQDWFAN